MKKRTVFLVVAILLAILVVAGMGLAKGEKEEKYTGCLNSGGEIKNVAVGDRPLKPCSTNETEISWDKSDEHGSGLYQSGLVGGTNIEECVVTKDGDIRCTKKLSISFEVNEGQPVSLAFDDGKIQLNAEKLMPPFKAVCQDEMHRSGAYLICIIFEQDKNTFQLGLSPSFPLNSIDEVLSCRLLKDTLVKCSLKGDRIRESTVEAAFKFKVSIAPYAAGSNETQLYVTVVNEEGKRASAVVSAPVCSFDLEPMVAQSVLLKRGEKRELVFELRTGAGFIEGNICQIWLLSPAGKVYEKADVTFPAPTKS